MSGTETVINPCTQAPIAVSIAGTLSSSGILTYQAVEPTSPVQTCISGQLEETDGTVSLKDGIYDLSPFSVCDVGEGEGSATGLEK